MPSASYNTKGIRAGWDFQSPQLAPAPRLTSTNLIISKRLRFHNIHLFLTCLPIRIFTNELKKETNHALHLISFEFLV